MKTRLLSRKGGAAECHRVSERLFGLRVPEKANGDRRRTCDSRWQEEKER